MNRFFWGRTGDVYITANVVLRSLVERVVEALREIPLSMSFVNNDIVTTHFP